MGHIDLAGKERETMESKKPWKRSGFFFALWFLLFSVAVFGRSPCVLWAGEKGFRGASSRGEERKETGMEDRDKLTEEEGKYLLSVARKTIDDRLLGRGGSSRPDQETSPSYSERRGTFVTLTIGGALRGCIGHIVPQESLIEGVRVNAINAAFRDPRFRPLSPKEWENVKIEVSILTDPRPLAYSDAEDLLRKLRPGIDGLIIKKGYAQATFLPQVWEQLPDKKEFLTHLCLKAGLDGRAWKSEKLEVLTYQVQAFHEQ
jgi:AmmeMemoRadiSam system protein A